MSEFVGESVITLSVIHYKQYSVKGMKLLCWKTLESVKILVWIQIIQYLGLTVPWPTCHFFPENFCKFYSICTDIGRIL